MNKSELRQELKSRRNNMTYQEVFEKSNEICDKIISSDFFKDAKTVMVYLSFKNEVNTRKIIENAFLKNKTVLVPITDGDDMFLSVLDNLTSFKKGAFGIDEPAVINKWSGKIDICIIPGLGFDKTGGRIGFGKGYYDKFLSKNPCTKIGIAYSEQIKENVFSEPHDIPMNVIVTEEEMFFIE